MAERYASEFHGDFSGAINQAVGRLVKAENEVDVIENGELEKIGPIYKTKGYVQRGSDVNTGYDVLGLCSAYKTDGTLKQIAVADGASESDAYTYNTSTDSWTPHHLSLTTGAKTEFEYFLDGFFMVNFEDATRFNDYTQWYTDTNVTSAAKAKYIKLYKSRIYLAYVVSNGTTYSSKVTYSNLPSGSPYTISWNDSVNNFDVDSDDADVIKGLAVNADRLLIFKENSLYRYDTNSLYKVPGCPGTISNRSIGNILGHTIYLHSTGLWRYDGTSSTLVSRKIKELIDGISTKNFANACHYVRGDHYYVYVGDVNNSVTGFTVDKCEIDYDVAKNVFTWKSLTKEPLIYSEFRDDRSNITYDDATITYNDANITYNGLVSSERRIYFGATDGAVYHKDTGGNYDGEDISFTVVTKDYYLNDPSIWKLLQHVIIYVSKGGKGITVQAKVDDKDWITLGRVDSEQKRLVFPDGTRCKRVKFRILEKSSGDRFAFEGIDIYYTPEEKI